MSNGNHSHWQAPREAKWHWVGGDSVGGVWRVGEKGWPAPGIFFL